MPGQTDNVNAFPTHICSFCGLDNHEAKGVMVAGPKVNICQNCISICVDLVFKRSAEKGESYAVHS